MKHVPHEGRNIAYHIEWSFRQQALRWIGDCPIGPNLHPLATELRAWLLKQGGLALFGAWDKQQPHAYTNLYTNDASALALLLSCVVNDAHAFSHASGMLDPLDAEVGRARLYSEQVLYTARVCEALIKQLLYCTAIPEGYYRGTALQGLLSRDCIGCWESQRLRHKLSLLGSLAHRYGLCIPFEQCLFEHMKLVVRRRDLEAAHSRVCELNPDSAAASRDNLGKASVELGNELVHMLTHVSELEQRMLDELVQGVLFGTDSAWRRSENK